MSRRNRDFAAALAVAASLLISSFAWAEDAPPAPAAAPAAAPVVPIEDVPREIEQAEQRLRGLAERLDFIYKEYVIPQETRDTERFERRMSRAEIQVLLKDYTSASVLLYEIVEDPANKAHPAYFDAVSSLANALYLDKNYFGAREYYRRLVEKGGRKYFQGSLKRLIEIASETGNYDGLETYFSLVRQLDAGALSSDIFYVLGRSLYLRGDVTRALEIFQTVADGTSHFLQARYFIGTILVKKGRFADAQAIFEDIARRKPEGKAGRLVTDLAHMAIGRILYEQGKYLEAADAYQAIDRDSEYFEESVYEVAWIYIKKGEFEKALQALDIMLLAPREVPVLLQSRVLRGNLLIKMGKHEDAVESFQDVVSRYGPIKDNLAALIDKHEDPVGYFEKLLGEGLSQVEAQKALPEVVVKWAAMDKQVGKAITVVKDLEGSRKSLDESFKMIERITGTLDSENRVNMFPVLKEARVKGIELKLELDSVRGMLNRIEDAVVSSKVSAAEREELSAARAERVRLEKQVGQMPKSQDGYKQISSQFARKLQDLEQVAFKMSVDIDGIKAQLTAIDKWYYETRDKRSNDPDDEKRFHEKIKIEWNAVAELGGDLREVLGVIDKEKTAMGIATDMGRDEKVRQAYRDALETERKMFDRLRKKLPEDAIKLCERVDAIRARLSQFYNDIGKFEGNLDRILTAKAAELKEKVFAEKKLLESYNAQADMVRKDTENLVGRIAYNGFRQAHRRFYDLVLQADVGIIDVVWKQKEEESKKILKIQSELDREMKGVVDEFSEAAEK
ncbi:MAG: tetratricopeptide repeat protein [Deltaproteobacteria bacterium]|nr:tetratricopeptide repeat protein [Deltaproteobacteria bacterium]